MNDFNPLNFLNRYVSANTKRSNKAPEMQNAPLSPKEMHAATLRPVLNVQNSHDTPFFMLYEGKLMAMGEKLFLLRELLALPKDLQEFLSNEMLKESSKLIDTISNSTGILSKLSAAEIMNLLSTNSPNASQKLMNMLCEFSKTQNTSAQKELKELFNFINTINISNQSQDANIIIKNFILFYLPWLPTQGAGGQNDFDFDIEIFEKNAKEDEEKENSQSATVTIRTLNFGIVKGILELKLPSNLLVLIYANDDFPSVMLEKLFWERTKTMNINSKMIREKSASKEVLKDKIKNQSVKIDVNTSINSYLLFAIYSLIRLIIETDKNYISSN